MTIPICRVNVSVARMGVVFLMLWASASVAGPKKGSTSTSDGWPEFRGPTKNGYAGLRSDAKPLGLPLQWSDTENIKWKTPIAPQGWSTPVVLEGQVWLTTATPEGNDFYAVCVDAETGNIRFNEKLFHCDSPEPLGNEVNGYASPTPTIEPGRVYIHFGSYGTACLDTATGKTLWKRTDLPCRHYRGPGSRSSSLKTFSS